MWTQILTALLVGLLIAFAFQLLLTSLGIAIGVTTLSFQSQTAQDSDEAIAQSPSMQSTAQIGFFAGLSILLTINSVLFLAAFLATKVSQIEDLLSGAIAGIIIWSAYFLILTWLSSTAVSSLVGLIFSTATGGFRRLVTTVTKAFGGEEETPLTSEMAIAMIRQEVQEAFSSIDLGQMNPPLTVNADSTETEPEKVDPKQLKAITTQLATLLEDQGDLSSFLQDHTTLTAEEIEQIVAQLQEIPHSTLTANDDELTRVLWQKFTAYLRHTPPKHLTPNQAQHKLEQLIEETQQNPEFKGFLPDFDRSSLETLLKRRKGLEKKQRKQILQQVEVTWNQAVQPGSESRNFLQTLYEQLPGVELDLDSIEQHLPEGLTVSSVVAWSLQQQLKRIDWQKISDPIVPLRDRLSSMNLDALPLEQLSTELQSATQQLINVPQQWTDNQVLPQIEAVRTQVTQQLDQLQTKIQQRIDSWKLQTQHRLEETRKAAMIAAWWLFATASTAAISAAIAGGLATQVHYV